MFESKREKELENEVERLKDNIDFLNQAMNTYIEKIGYYSKLNGSLNETIRLKNEEINSLKHGNFKLKKEEKSITQEEYTILKNLGGCVSGIFRKDGNLYLGHLKREIKMGVYFREWKWTTDFSIYNHLFQFVIDNATPVLISDILDRETI